MPSLISSLSATEKEALSLCGITTDAQLARTTPAALRDDLAKAQKIFPELTNPFSPARLEELCAMAADRPAQQEEEVQATTAPDFADAPRDTVHQPGQGTTDVIADASHRILPDLAPRTHQHRSRSYQTPVNLEAAPGRSRSVHCARPVATYISAVTMLMFYAGLTELALIPFLLFMGFLDEAYIYAAGALGIALLVPYVIFGAWVHCSVCKMLMFTLRPYNISRHAHKVPFFGLTTVLTSLHIILFLWYRCPACGTSIRLYRHRR